MNTHTYSDFFDTTGPILPKWELQHSKLFGKVPLALSHSLHRSALFSRDALCDLIDRCPEDKYNLCTMGADPTNPQWRDGHLSGVGGKDVLRAIENGCIWLNLRRVHEVSKPHGALLNAIYKEIEEKVPGLKTFKHNLGILISSPNAKVHYHADIPGQSLWQISGRKRIYIYPNHEPFLQQRELENVILGHQQEEIAYERWFDDYAQVYELEPGQMLHWPLNGPHRVENHDCLNISITTEHFTGDIRKAYAVNYANGVIRRYTGIQKLSSSTDGPMVLPKAALALAWRKLGLEKKRGAGKIMADFKPDPNSATGFVDIPAFPKAT